MVPHRELTVDIIRIRVRPALICCVCLSILSTDQKKRSSVGRLLGYSHLYHPYGLIDRQELRQVIGLELFSLLLDEMIHSGETDTHKYQLL